MAGFGLVDCVKVWARGYNDTECNNFMRYKINWNNKEIKNKTLKEEGSCDIGKIEVGEWV